MDEVTQTSRRDWLAAIFMAVGLAVSYGMLVIQGILFLLPERLKPRTRRLFAGQIDQFARGEVRTFHDLQGNEILVKLGDAGFQAFSSVCPHLGCRVHWEADKQRFFCPCHNGVFNADGIAIAGPPAAAGQSLFPVTLDVDQASGVVYLEVKDVQRRRT